ncbi:MAG: acetate--CoA ligase family protein [Xanthobacteraceae bacterium]
MEALTGDNVLARLNPLFQPANVAIIGASKTEGKQGHTALVYLRRCGFSGNIFPINPTEREIEGLPCYASIADVPAPVDCALLVIPAASSVAAVRDCATHGVRLLIIGATGYAELGTNEGRARQSDIVNIAGDAGMRVLGPNTNGIYNATDKFSFGYNRSHGEPLSPGPVSVVAHSGALFNSLLPRLRELGVGLSKFVPVGNEADLTMLDFLEYFIADPDTRVIGMIIEAISDGPRFRELALRAHGARKPIVALKLGRSRAGAGATEAHSSRLAGSARAYEAFFRAYGIASVPTVEALAGACAVMLATHKRVPNKSLICVSSTGGGASMIADFAADRGLALAGNPDGTWGGKVAETIARFKDIGIVRNPTDTGAFPSQQQILNDIFHAQEADGYCGPVMVFTHSLPTIENSQLIANMLSARQQRTGSPVVVAAPGGLPKVVEDTYRDNGVPFFHELSTAFDSLQAYYDTLPQAGDVAPPRDNELVSLGQDLARGVRFLSEIESADILRRAGVPMVESRSVTTKQDACTRAATLGFPIVLKALAPGVAHKNKLGFVITGISDDSGLTTAYEQLGERLKAHGFAPADVPIIVQPMLSGKAELILGVTTEMPFGHFLVAGLGGIYTELFNDVVLFPVPISPDTIREWLKDATVGKLACQIGGDIALDRITDALSALQKLVLAHSDKIQSIDVNPLLLTELGLVAVDALIVSTTRR